MCVCCCSHNYYTNPTTSSLEKKGRTHMAQSDATATNDGSTNEPWWRERERERTKLQQCLVRILRRWSRPRGTLRYRSSSFLCQEESHDASSWTTLSAAATATTAASSLVVLRQSSAPVRPLQVLTDPEAVARDALCRFCLDGPSSLTIPPSEQQGPTNCLTTTSHNTTNTTTTNTTTNTTNTNSLVAPCNCKGGSEWVHVQCLRSWQRQVVLSSYLRAAAAAAAGRSSRGWNSNHHHPPPAVSTAATICNVCTYPYLLPPLSPFPTKLRKNVLQRGTLLVARMENGDPTGFHKTVVLLLNDCDDRTTSSSTAPTCGLILNAPSAALPRGGGVPCSLKKALPPGVHVSGRRGGPVCGGTTFGMSRFVVGHTFPQTNDGEYCSRAVPLGKDPTNEPPTMASSRSGSSSSSSVDCNEERSNRTPTTTTTTKSLNLVYASTNRRSPVVLEGKQLTDVVRQLIVTPLSSSQEQQPAAGRLFLFSGYCKWGKGKLEKEVKAGIWSVCDNGTVGDILRDDNDIGSVWEDLVRSERLLSSHQLYD